MGFTPSLGLGIGYARVLTKSKGLVFGGAIVPGSSGSASDAALAFQAMDNLYYHFTDKVDLGLGYRFFVTAHVDSLADKSYQNHLFNGEVIYHII